MNGGGGMTHWLRIVSSPAPRHVVNTCRFLQSTMPQNMACRQLAVLPILLSILTRTPELRRGLAELLLEAAAEVGGGGKPGAIGNLIEVQAGLL